ncbi:hypothetical protein [Colwellia echini]|uniref:Uncharacterized protein n=1 Tax=Colwellia echini TaxID=1982103 RepID=A0ABY3MX12_9GAMM|nr:hypothetical protein [Colwellia echini]TYK65696.1 hypothetical protein CWS31_008550 [Colwellia echini]
MKYILLIIATLTLTACNENNSANTEAEDQSEIVQEETALETAGLIPPGTTLTLLAPSSDQLPKALFAPQLN